MNFSLSDVWTLYALQSVCTAFDSAAGFAEDDLGDMGCCKKVVNKAFATYEQTTLSKKKSSDSPET